MKSNTPRSGDVHPGPGFRICLDFPRLNASLMKRLLDFEVPDISDSLNRLYALDPAIRYRTNRSHRICGPACTVRVFPGDNLMVHKALDIARPGDVIVIDSQGARSANAVLGDIICMKARSRDIAGFVVDGLVRDMPGIQELDFPVFARGTTSVGPLHRGPGEINFPISCGGTVVNPGDVIVADASGIVAVPRQSVELVVQRLDEDRNRQESYLAAVRRGEFSNEWADNTLKQQGCPIYDRANDTVVSPDSSYEQPTPPHPSDQARSITAKNKHS